jgi:hypothetical protein
MSTDSARVTSAAWDRPAATKGRAFLLQGRATANDDERSGRFWERWRWTSIAPLCALLFGACREYAMDQSEPWGEVTRGVARKYEPPVTECWFDDGLMHAVGSEVECEAECTSDFVIVHVRALDGASRVEMDLYFQHASWDQVQFTALMWSRREDGTRKKATGGFDYALCSPEWRASEPFSVRFRLRAFPGGDRNRHVQGAVTVIPKERP